MIGLTSCEYALKITSEYDGYSWRNLGGRSSFRQLEGGIMSDTLDTGKDSLAGEELEESVLPIWEKATDSSVEPDLEQTDDEPKTQKKGTTVSDILLSTGKWYILVDSTDGEKIAYEKKDLKTSLRANVLAGKHNMNSPAIVFRQKPTTSITKNATMSVDQLWIQTATTLGKFSKKNCTLGSLYQPIRSHAMTGLRLGALIGIYLKCIDSAILLYPQNRLMAVGLILSCIVASIPKIGWILFTVLLVISSLYPGLNNIAFVFLGAVIAGSILAALPGMTIGGIVGWIRRKSLPLAPDAVSEPPSAIIKFVLLPFLGGFAVFIAYLYFIIFVF